MKEAEEPQEDRYLSDPELLDIFLRGQPLPDFVRIYWTDYTASLRVRMVPFRKFSTALSEDRTDIGITKATFGLLQNDWMVPGTLATGEYRLHPDFSSLKRGPIDGHISMYGEFREKSGARVDLCPRSLLSHAVELGAENNLTFLLGFEIEFLLVERLDRNSGSAARYATLLTDGHAWSVSRYFADPKIAKLLKDIVSTLEETGIFVEQIHAESATGQFELILPPLPPVQAVDTLLHARDTISALATAAGYKMTLHPKPFAMACGTAAHTHMSISSANGSKPRWLRSLLRRNPQAPAQYHSFHLQQILSATSVSPMVSGREALGLPGGTQNRETPLRKIEGQSLGVEMHGWLGQPIPRHGSRAAGGH